MFLKQKQDARGTPTSSHTPVTSALAAEPAAAAAGSSKLQALLTHVKSEAKADAAPVPHPKAVAAGSGAEPVPNVPLPQPKAPRVPKAHASAFTAAAPIETHEDVSIGATIAATSEPSENDQAAPGWKKLTDDQHGEYYVNLVTGVTQWEVPLELQTETVVESKTEWEQYNDSETGTPYWFCEATGESTWTDPLLASGTDGIQSDQPLHGAEQESQALPEEAAAGFPEPLIPAEGKQADPLPETEVSTGIVGGGLRAFGTEKVPQPVHSEKAPVPLKNDAAPSNSDKKQKKAVRASREGGNEAKAGPQAEESALVKSVQKVSFDLASIEARYEKKISELQSKLELEQKDKKQTERLLKKETKKTKEFEDQLRKLKISIEERQQAATQSKSELEAVKLTAAETEAELQTQLAEVKTQLLVEQEKAAMAKTSGGVSAVAATAATATPMVPSSNASNRSFFLRVLVFIVGFSGLLALIRFAPTLSNDDAEMAPVQAVEAHESAELEGMREQQPAPVDENSVVAPEVAAPATSEIPEEQVKEEQVSHDVS
jgi:hypothetical protein